MRSANAPAPGCTAPTGSPRTRSASASSSAAGRRSRASTKPSPRRRSRTPASRSSRPTRETRKAVWRLAGLERSAAGLDELANDPHPLARLVAVSAAAREETRGSHARAEFAELDPRLDEQHTILDAGTEHPPLRAMALLIDWGGVLTTSMMGSFDAFSRREGVDVRTAFRENEAVRGALIELECGRIDIPTFEQRVATALNVDPTDLARRLTQDVRPDQAMLDAVRAFHDGGVPTALVSNSWREDDYDVDDLFDVIVLSGRLGIRKPDPRIYAVAAERLGVSPDRCVFVDDLGGNLKPAKALGMTTIRHVQASSTISQLQRLLSPSNPS